MHQQQCMSNFSNHHESASSAELLYHVLIRSNGAVCFHFFLLCKQLETEFKCQILP